LKDAHNLLDKLLEQATPVLERVMNDFLIVLALHLLDLALAFFSRLLRTGLGMNLVTFGNLLKCLYDARRTYANTVMCSRLLKCFCDGRRSGWMLELLQMMAKEEQTPHLCCQIHHGH
jgi:hypothetical protein